MGQVSQALGIGTKIQHGGKEYTISPWTYAIQGEYERYLEEHAVATLLRLKHLFPAEDYDMAFQKTLRDINSGVYSFGTPTVAESFRNMKHLTHLLYLCIEVNHPEVSYSLVQDLVKEKLDEMMAKMNQANADPNPKTPA